MNHTIRSVENLCRDSRKTKWQLQCKIFLAFKRPGGVICTRIKCRSALWHCHNSKDSVALKTLLSDKPVSFFIFLFQPIILRNANTKHLHCNARLKPRLHATPIRIQSTYGHGLPNPSCNALADLEKSKGGFTTTRQWLLLSRRLYKITLGRETISTEFSIKGGFTCSLWPSPRSASVMCIGGLVIQKLLLPMHV